MERRVSTASSWVKAISPGLAIGPPACSFRSLARPSQNWARFMRELRTVGELMGPRCQLWPIEVLRLSEPPMLRLWQLLHEMKPDLESRGSKNSFFPSSTAAGLTAFGAGTGETGSSDCATAAMLLPSTAAAAMARRVQAILGVMGFSLSGLSSRMHRVSSAAFAGANAEPGAPILQGLTRYRVDLSQRGERGLIGRGYERDSGFAIAAGPGGARRQPRGARRSRKLSRGPSAGPAGCRRPRISWPQAAGGSEPIHAASMRTPSADSSSANLPSSTSPEAMACSLLTGSLRLMWPRM